MKAELVPPAVEQDVVLRMTMTEATRLRRVCQCKAPIATEFTRDFPKSDTWAEIVNLFLDFQRALTAAGVSV